MSVDAVLWRSLSCPLWLRPDGACLRCSTTSMLCVSLGINFAPFPFVTGLREGSAAELLAVHNPGLRAGICVTHIGDDPIAGLSLEASTQLMQNAGRPLTLCFRALPSPFATGRPNDTIAAAHDMVAAASAAAGRERELPPEPEPEPERGLQPHHTGILDESVPVGLGAAAAEALDML